MNPSEYQLINSHLARQMTGSEKVFWAIHKFLIRLRRKLPYLIWYGQEVDVQVQFVTFRLLASDIDGAVQQFNSGAIYDAEKALLNAGIKFDTGMGCSGRDWGWDFSLKGPIRVRFSSRAKRPENRNRISPPKERQG